MMDDSPAPDTHYNLMLDHQANLIISRDDAVIVLPPAEALMLIKFIERTGYQAHAHSVAKGGAQ